MTRKVKIIIPDVLRSYTGSRAVTAVGTSVIALFDDLERQFPGFRFRVINELDELRPNFKLFVNGTLEKDLSVSVGAMDELFIMQALSGG